MTFTTLVYKTDGPIATITLNRPNELNTIVPPMPEEFEQAINLAVRDAIGQSHYSARRRALVLRRL